MHRSALLANRAAYLQSQYPTGTACYWWKRREDVSGGEVAGKVGVISSWGTSIDGQQLGAWIKDIGFVPFECVKVSLTLTKEMNRV